MRGTSKGSALFSLLLVLGLGAPARAHDRVPATAQDRPILLKGGDLYTVSHGVMPATDLLFADGKIVAIGKGLVVPAGAEVVDVSGKRVYPGMIAPQTNLGLSEIDAVRATNDWREVGGITPEVAANTAFNPDSELLPTIRNHGVTTAQIVPSGLIAGRTFITHLDGWTKEDAAVKLIDGLAVTWPQMGVVRAWWMTDSAEEQRKQNEEARQGLMRAFDKARAYDLARKQDPKMPIDQRWEAMRGVFDGSLPVYIAADDERQIVQAVAFATERKLRMVLVGGAEADHVASLLAANHIPVILHPTLSLPGRTDDPYDQPFRRPYLLHQAGVKFCLSTEGGTDQRNLPLQAGQATAFDLPADVALRAVTLSTAEILGIAESEGSLDVGKDATLFISRGDVLDTLGQHVERVFIRGRAVDLDDKQKALERKYRAKPPALAAAKP